MTTKHYDVAVIGGGLAGLTAAVKLAASGQSVILLEKQQRLGGLCGTDECDGYQYTIACNDFGRGMIDELAALGVKTRFVSKKSIVYYQDERLTAPIGIKFVAQLLKSPWQLLRMIHGIVRMKTGRTEIKTIGQFCRRFMKPGRLKDIAEIPAYLMGVCPEDFNLAYLNYEKQFGYNYNHPGVPVGGPNQLVNDLVERCEELGVTIYTGQAVAQHLHYTNGYQINCANSLHIAAQVIDTRERRGAYPLSIKRGLPLTQLRVVLKDSQMLSDDVHTHLYYPQSAGEAMSRIDNGEWVDDFPFHLFHNDFAQAISGATVNLYFYLPRDVELLPDDHAEQLAHKLLQRADSIIPGFLEATVSWSFLFPRQFQERFGSSPRVMPFVWMGKKPEQQGDEKHYFFAGHTVYPPGDHAGAAVLSALTVSNKILEKC
ncbi:phytoene desaturase family protein [Thalassotalea fusca]